MSANLKIILRIKQMLEEASECELKNRGNELREVESAAERQRCQVDAARAECLTRLTEGGSDISEWLIQNSDAEIYRWRQETLKVLLASRRLAVDLALQDFRAHRTDSRQIGALVTLRDKAGQELEARREQMRLDDWFRMKRDNHKSRIQ